MTPSDDKKLSPENSHESDDSVVRIDASEDSIDLENEMADGIIAEIAGEIAAENKSDAAAKTGQTQQTAQKKDDATADDRLALRDRLLKTAPKENVMRSEIVKELEQKKIQLENDIRGYERRKEYDMWSASVAQLRAVLRQLELVARAGYEALKEIWLKVVHKFA